MNRVSLKDESIIITYDYDGQSHENYYPVPLSACNSNKLLVQMVYHLSQKTWITPELLTQFIELACEKNRLTLPNQLL